MSRLAPSPTVWLLAPDPPPWSIALGPSVVDRRSFSGIAESRPDVLVVATPHEVDTACAVARHHGIPVIGVGAPTDPTPFDDHLTPPITPAGFWLRIRVHHRLARLEANRARAERLDRQATFMAGLAHELRNPIHALVSGMSALESLLPEDLEPRVARLIDVLNQSAGRLRGLVADVNDFHGTLGPCGNWDAGPRIAATLALLTDQTDGIEVSVDADPEAVVVGFPQKIDQVLLNLVVNALRAAGPGGRVDIVARRHRDHIEVEVSDTGPGVPPERWDEIFEPFVTTHRDSGGTGLGLPLSRSIAESHGGALTVTSTLGEGATFTLRLPRVPAPAANASLSAEPA